MYSSIHLFELRQISSSALPAIACPESFNNNTVIFPARWGRRERMAVIWYTDYASLLSARIRGCPSNQQILLSFYILQAL